METSKTCDVCHKIIELYENKKNKLLEKNSLFIVRLQEIKKIPLYNFTIETFCEIIDELGFSLPTIDKMNHLISAQISSPSPYLHQNKYYYGYKVISDSVLPLKLVLKKEKKIVKRNSKNFIDLNKRNLLRIINQSILNSRRT